MLSLYKIWTVARYETKTLLRSWFFRIFSILAIAILIFISIGLHTKVGRTPWFFKGMDASLPYMYIQLLNIVQAIIGVFLASDFLKRDKKLDTTEVIYMRSMTNGDYVLGKSLGILLVFMALNMLVLLVAAVFHLFFSQTSFLIIPYLAYPLFISIPTLVFIFGLAFLFMVVIRNQAVTFILLLGYIAITLFFLSDKMHYIFDYMTFNVPLMYSGIIGFGNLDNILIHRGIYFLLGVAFIFATILRIKRLPQSQAMTRVSLLAFIICSVIAIFLISAYLNYFSTGSKLRTQMNDLNQKFLASNKLTPLSNKLKVIHQGKQIDASASLVFQNSQNQPIDKYIFSLNPGLQVISVSSGQQPLNFDRNLHLINIQATKPLAVGATDSLVIYYNGSINEQACYPEISDEERFKLFRIWIYNVAKRFAIIEPRYVLLTPEANWYPAAGLPHGAAYPKINENDFINFNLTIKSSKELTIISQGKKTEISPGEFNFSCEHPLSAISLIIGDYEQRSITVDSLEYSVYNYRGHDYFSPYFNAIGDTLPSVIRDLKQDYEGKLDLEYPFLRLSLVEVPIQFFYYPRLWTINYETVQPELVLMSEKGLLADGADFDNQKRWQEQRTEHSNQTITPQESQSNIFSQFVRRTLFGSSMGRRFGPENIMSITPKFDIIPNYYTFVNHFKSAQWPIFNVALESYLSQRTASGADGFRRFFVGLSDDEKANLALMKQNLVEILADPEKKDIVNSVLKLKGAYLFNLIKSKIDTEKFDTFLKNILKEKAFQDADVNLFIEELYKITNFDLKPHFDDWYKNRELPGMLVADFQAFKILDESRTRYQVRFKVENTEPVEGLISVSFRLGGGGRGFFGPPGADDQPEDKFFSLTPSVTKEIGIVLDEQPRMVTINTLVSKNLPTTITKRFEDLELNDKIKAFEGEQILKERIQLSAPGEIIVDNEDAGFKILTQQDVSFLKKLLQSKKEEDEEYIGFNFWRAPSVWRKTSYADFYGKYIHSAHYLKAGKGEKKVAWEAEIKENGNYDIYYHAAQIQFPWMRRGPEGGSRGRQAFEQFHFVIHHDDGADNVSLNADNTDSDPWRFLGTYYLSAGTAKVELTDESKGRVVFADAVKWVIH